MGRFIVLEGGEAAGKSTQAARLAAELGAVLTREPGGTALGEALRGLLLGPAVADLSFRAEVLLMLAARAQHVVEVIEPALARGRDVVCDRFTGSTLAYQGFGRGLPLSELTELDRWATVGREPDVVVLLDVPLGAARERRPCAEPDRFESEGGDFAERVRSGFLQLAAERPDRWHVIDGTLSQAEVAAAVRKALD